ncbi:hypothetical protein DFH06DRAFT_1173781 [Mycena polygramma]|nr:hypothetical protein DFH06DRAFT_1173781 [Mycena polygramma]
MSFYYPIHSPPPARRNSPLYPTDESTMSMDSPYESKYQPTHFGVDESPRLTEYSPDLDFTDLLPDQSFGRSPDLRVLDNTPAHSRRQRPSVGAQYYHAHGSINDGLFHSDHSSPWPLEDDLSLRALNITDEEAFFPQSEHKLYSPGRMQRPAHFGGSESPYHAPYHATNNARMPPRAKSAAHTSRAHLQPSRSQSPASHPYPQGLRLQPNTTVHDFVHMNDSFISTDLPEESPFALIPADARSASFPGHPYPDGHQWPQTFKITEVKQIGPKKQTLACFFCRSRKIACAPKPVDGTDDRSCEQCERRGIDCKYPKESKRGQHNRIRPNGQKVS